MTTSTGYEREALSKRTPVTDCPACRDAGKRLRFFTTLSWEEPSSGRKWIARLGGPPTVCCNDGHLYICASWTVGENGTEYVLIKRL